MAEGHEHKHKNYRFGGVDVSVCPHMLFVVATAPIWNTGEEAWVVRQVIRGDPFLADLCYQSTNLGPAFRKRLGVCNELGVGTVLLEE